MYRTRLPAGEGPRAAMLRVFGASLIAFIVLLGMGLPAAAEPPPGTQCLTHTEVSHRLARAFSEVPAAFGIADDGGLVEVFKTGAGETWTIVMTQPGRATCWLASGVAWLDIEPPVETSQVLGHTD